MMRYIQFFATRVTTLLAAVIVIGGCANGVDLRPAPATATNGEVDNTVVDTVGNIRVRVQADTWSGDPGVIEDVTPLKVRIENNGDRPLRVRYDQFALISADGQRYSALPPRQVNGSVSEQVRTGSTGAVDPGFRHSGYSVAPYYGSAYSGVGRYGGAFGYNSGYYNNYYNYWKTVSHELPTEHMVEVGIPDGVVMPGGYVDGFLYFEKSAPKTQRLTFRADLVDVQTSDQMGEITIPFVVKNQ